MKRFENENQHANGFSLTEVMIGIMILTVAIVSASNLLVGLLTSNQNNLSTLQAYYLAQEGIEAVRNIRDTNWLHNRNWLGAENWELWGSSFQLPANFAAEGDDCGSSGTVNCYVVDLEARAFNQSPNSDLVATLGELIFLKPWSVKEGKDGAIFRNDSDSDVILAGSKPGAIDTGFKRTIMIKKYDCDAVKSDFPCKLEDQDKYVLVQSKVVWKLGAKEREFTLSEVLTDWKGGSF